MPFEAAPDRARGLEAMMVAMNGPRLEDVPVAVIEAFCFDGTLVTTQALAGGHIHRNILVTSSGGRYVLQRLNDRVFPDLDAVLSNVERVVAHLKSSGQITA
jgi:hypothetical protein